MEHNDTWCRGRVTVTNAAGEIGLLCVRRSRSTAPQEQHADEHVARYCGDSTGQCNHCFGRYQQAAPDMETTVKTYCNPDRATVPACCGAREAERDRLQDQIELFDGVLRSRGDHMDSAERECAHSDHRHRAKPSGQAFLQMAAEKQFLGKSLNHQCRHQADRKSTRLNSSHVAISYAVFCLTKKKQ